jgi:hypothetical protein
MLYNSKPTSMSYQNKVCKNLCRIQNTYETLKIRKWRDEYHRWCQECEILFINCDNSLCICCGKRLKYKTGTALEIQKEKTKRNYTKQKEWRNKNNNGQTDSKQ